MGVAYTPDMISTMVVRTEMVAVIMLGWGVMVDGVCDMCVKILCPQGLVTEFCARRHNPSTPIHNQTLILPDWSLPNGDMGLLCLSGVDRLATITGTVPGG